MQSPYIWVAVRVNDGVQQAGEYRGRMDAEIFEKIINNELSTGWFRLDSVFWDRDRIEVSQSEAGAAWGYSDTSFFRIEWIARIIILTDSFVQSLTKSGSRH